MDNHSAASFFQVRIKFELKWQNKRITELLSRKFPGNNRRGVTTSENFIASGRHVGKIILGGKRQAPTSNYSSQFKQNSCKLAVESNQSIAQSVEYSGVTGNTLFT
jgi:hypothetical protein